jgi:hypothetical protein
MLLCLIKASVPPAESRVLSCVSFSRRPVGRGPENGHGTSGQDSASGRDRGASTYRQVRVEKTRSPSFLGDPSLHAPLFDPGGPLTPGLFRVSHTAFRLFNDAGSALLSPQKLDHAACKLPVYALQSGSPPDHATLGPGWGQTFTGSGLATAGSQRGFPSWTNDSPVRQALPGAIKL